MQMPLYLRNFFPILLALPMMIISCSSTTTPEEIAATFIKQSEIAFEEGNIRALKKLVSSNYQDTHNRGAGDVIAIAAAYIRSSKSMYLFSDLDSAYFEGDLIQARVLTAFAARPIMDKSVLGRMQADIYWFDITLVEESGGWKLVAALWQQAKVEDFFENRGQN